MVIEYLRKILKKNKIKQNDEEINLFTFKRKKDKNFIIKINFIDKIKKSYIFAFILALIILSSIFANSFLRINIVIITKNDDITNLSIAYKSIDRFRGKFLFMVNDEDIKNALLVNQKNLKDINITKLPINTLKIDLTSYDSIFKTIFNEKNYIITSNWVLVPNSNKNNTLRKLDLKTNKETNFPDYKIIISEKYLEKIQYLENKLLENILNIKINSLEYYITERELHIVNWTWTRLIFDLEWNLDKQIKQLAIFNKDYFNLSWNWMIYIDLRINNKIFYCASWENQVNTLTCINNLTNIYWNRK